MLYTCETGTPGQPAILFLHAGGLSSTSWQPVIDHLPAFHCLAPDLPEQGKSRHIPYSILGAAEESAEVIRQRVPSGKAHVVALSLGGPVAFTMLRIAPQLVDRVLVSGSSGQVSRFQSQMAVSMLWIYRFFSKNYLVNATMKQQSIPEKYASLVRDDFLASIEPGFMRRYMTDLARWQLPERIDSPLMVVVGQKEVKAAYTFARSYLAKFPHARGVIAPDGGHVWSLQYPERFAALVRAWVTGQPLPEGFVALQ